MAARLAVNSRACPRSNGVRWAPPGLLRGGNRGLVFNVGGNDYRLSS